jgi:hypothetical protein
VKGRSSRFVEWPDRINKPIMERFVQVVDPDDVKEDAVFMRCMFMVRPVDFLHYSRV